MPTKTIKKWTKEKGWHWDHDKTKNYSIWDNAAVHEKNKTTKNPNYNTQVNNEKEHF